MVARLADQIAITGPSRLMVIEKRKKKEMTYLIICLFAIKGDIDLSVIMTFASTIASLGIFNF
jgi:hypothetical protein